MRESRSLFNIITVVFFTSLSFDGVGFTDPITVPGADPVSGKPWILLENDGKIHLFFESRYTRASGIKIIQGCHQEGYLDSGFGEKEMINHDAELYDWLEPRIDSEGILHVVGIRDYDDGYSDWKGYHFLKMDRVSATSQYSPVIMRLMDLVSQISSGFIPKNLK